MSLAAAIRRSAYTILLLVFAAAAIGWKLLGTGSTTWFSVSFGVIGAIIAIAAWLTPRWRRHAGALRHSIVAIAGLACAVIAVLGIMSLR